MNIETTSSCDNYCTLIVKNANGIYSGDVINSCHLTHRDNELNVWSFWIEPSQKQLNNLLNKLNNGDVTIYRMREVCPRTDLIAFNSNSVTI